MSLDPKIAREIVEYKSQDLNLIKEHIKTTYGKFLTVGIIKKVLDDNARLGNIRAAKEQASVGLTDKVSLMEDVGKDLLAAFKSTDLPFKERIEAAKELRQWTKLNIDTSGIHDDENDLLFVIGSEWAVEGYAEEG